MYRSYGLLQWQQNILYILSLVVKLSVDIGRKPAGMSSVNNVEIIYIYYFINHYHRMIKGFIARMYRYELAGPLE